MCCQGLLFLMLFYLTLFLIGESYQLTGWAESADGLSIIGGWSGVASADDLSAIGGRTTISSADWLSAVGGQKGAASADERFRVGG